MPAKTPQTKIDEALSLYASGWSSTDIGEKIGVSASVVCRYAKLAGLSRDPAAAKSAQYEMKPKSKLPVVAGEVCGLHIGGEKVCAACGKTFPADLEHFYKRTRANGRVYLSSCCKECVKDRREKFVSANKEKVHESNKRTREKFGRRYSKEKWQRTKSDPLLLEKAREKQKMYILENSERIKIRLLAYNKANADLRREQARKYYTDPANKAMLRTHRANRKARVRGADGSFSKTDVEARLAEQNGRCFWCKDETSQEFHIDHFLPLAQGGTNHPYNIVISCPTCNISRGKKLPAEFFAYMRWVADNADFIQERRNYYTQKMREYRERERRARS